MKKFLCFMAMVCLLSACGTPKEREVTVSDVDITGLIKDYIKVVDGSYKFTNDGDNAFITVKFELIKVNVGTEICRRKHPEDIRINPIGETGEIFDTGTYGFTTSRTETSKLKDLLNTGSTGDTKSISFKWDFFGNDSSDDIAKSIFTKATTFEVIDNTFSYCSDLTESATHWDDLANAGISSSVSNSTSDSSDWDKILDEYEKYIDKYIEMYKKAKDGDISMMSSYAEMLETAESYGDKLSKAKGNLSASQMGRYLKLTEKMASGLME